MKRKILWIASTLLVIAGLSGCARGGNDVFARAQEDVENHVLILKDDLYKFHHFFDWWILDLDPEEPDLYE